MSRIELPEPSSLPPYLRNLHDGARAGDWSTRHVARAFADNADLLERYLDFYYPFHRDAGLIESRLKELVRLRIATPNGCKTCKAGPPRPGPCERRRGRVRCRSSRRGFILAAGARRVASR